MLDPEGVSCGVAPSVEVETLVIYIDAAIDATICYERVASVARHIMVVAEHEPDRATADSGADLELTLPTNVDLFPVEARSVRHYTACSAAYQRLAADLHDEEMARSDAKWMLASMPELLLA